MIPPPPPASMIRSLLFPAAIAGVVALAVAQPQLFLRWAGLETSVLIVPLIQVIMFGMGATLSLADFTRVARMPVPILIGFLLQYTVMPLLGCTFAHLFIANPEIAAGVILVGSVAGGVASNVVTYLAGGNVPLSVTMTLCSTLAGPFATPFLMKLLAGRMIPIHVGEMMLSILNMIVLPIVIGLATHGILRGRAAWTRRPLPLLALASLLSIALGLCLTPSLRGSLPDAVRIGLLLGFAFMVLMILAKVVLELGLRRTGSWFERVLPPLSMAGIAVIIGVITARARPQLLDMGLALLAVAVLHNLCGYLLGYWGARACRLGESDCRTIAIEVGMQNSGMAAGLAMTVLKSPAAALAAVVFGPWMNLSGALLASWWKQRPTRPNHAHAQLV